MKFKPTADKIMVKPDVVKEKTLGGIYIPEAYQEKSNTGIVLKVGCGTPDDPMEIKPGDKVTFPSKLGYSIEVEGEDVLILRKNQIIYYEPKKKL